MATITKTIGTNARDYSTMTLWAAALGGAAGGSGNDAVGVCYDDSEFDELVTISDGTPDSRKLTVAVGERGDGTAGTGARMVSTAIDRGIKVTIAPTIVEWLEHDSNGFRHDIGFANAAIDVDTNNSSDETSLRNLIVHGNIGSLQGGLAGIGIQDGKWAVVNSILYDVENTRSAGGLIWWLKHMPGRSNPGGIYNSTGYKTTAAFVGHALGWGILDEADITVQNVIGTDSGDSEDFAVSSPSNATMDHNLSSDITASGTGSLTEKTSANQFVFTVEGSEDLHLKDTDADAFEAGTDLLESPAGVNFDIDNYDRHAGGTTWSIGAHDGNNLRVAPTGNRRRRLLIGA